MRGRLNVFTTAAVALLFAALTACDGGPKSPKGFRLPDGDVAKGKAAFIELKCTQCHIVSGVELPKPQGDVGPVLLGGEVVNLHTYGQLVTMMINPSHTLVTGHPRENVSEDGKSRMPNFNETMTVQQLIDLVAFLQARYRIKPPETWDYPYPYGTSQR